MKVVFNSEIDGDSKLTEIQVIDDDFNVLESATIYAEKSFDSYYPGIFKSDNSLYSIMQHLYNSGKNQEEIDFELNEKEVEEDE